MLEHIPTEEEMELLLGKGKYDVWKAVCAAVESRYEMDKIWNRAGKKWDYEYKYRRGGKTLCCLYAKKECFGFMIIFGGAEREKFEAQRMNFPEEITDVYDQSETYHDGKWMMFQVEDTHLMESFMSLLAVKRKPNKKNYASGS
ncbi:DUF3788 domain-containing protein [Clostridium sp. AM58-1XD]|uniref:DUF3788 domain-containing protein n=1 Tax=Clostridium sp. AM58-1XD TaxID=2292307 RepID=UPI000E4F3377|nr:DUF3788 domain-containing protein [Clostridium sp. AM58-1XD]RGZ00482.1 DUF3788 domain-containing protein [Clostridium sp. AM58-1XD]